MTSACAVVDLRRAGRSPDVRLRASAPQRWTLQRRAADGWHDLVHEVVGGGIFGGDANRTTVRVGGGTRVAVRGVSATPVRGMRPSLSATRLVAEADASVLYIPGALIPQIGANHTSTLLVEAVAGARVIVASVIVPGRSASGERGHFARLRLRTVIRVDRRVMFAEDATVEPSGAPIDAPAAFAGEGAAVSVLAIGNWAPATLDWWDAVDLPAGLRGGVSRLRGCGVGYRALCPTLGDALVALETIEARARAIDAVR